jgi:Skp family chaperone for outer membrane proteins
LQDGSNARQDVSDRGVIALANPAGFDENTTSTRTSTALRRISAQLKTREAGSAFFGKNIMNCLKPRIFTYLSRATLVLGMTSVGAHVSAAPARAEFKLVTVDVNRVINEAKSAQAQRKHLEELSASAKKKVEEKRKPLAEMESKLKSGKIDENSKEVEKFRKDAVAFERFAKDTEEELRKEFMKINKELTDQVLATVKSYAENNDIQMVLDKSEKGRGPVLFGAASADITNDVIDAINSR